VSLPFDRIQVAEGDGSRDLTVDEFVQLPLYERVQLILQNRVTFWNLGQVVKTSEALGQLRTLLAESKEP
jgi:hypothetical protein